MNGTPEAQRLEPASPAPSRPVPSRRNRPSPTAHSTIRRAPIPMAPGPPARSGGSTAPPGSSVSSPSPNLPQLPRPEAASHLAFPSPEGVWISFYGASRQDAPPLHDVPGCLGDQPSLFPPPGTVPCGVGWKARGWLSPLWVGDSGVYRSRFVLRSEVGTILLSGALGPMASFGSPGGHSRSRGTRACRPGPES